VECGCLIIATEAFSENVLRAFERGISGEFRVPESGVSGFPERVAVGWCSCGQRDGLEWGWRIERAAPARSQVR